MTRTTCRICESACGLVADTVPDLPGGRIIGLRPDPDHPVSRGFACVKGTRFHERVQQHPDRVLRPRIRTGDGWQDASWDRALEAVGARLRPILDRHGPDAVGLYSGNAAGHAFGTVLGLTALQRALGTLKHYSCLTLDNSEMFVVAEEVFGDPLATFVADYARSDLVVLIGTDPRASQASQSQSHPGAMADLRTRARAGQLVVVDPRRSDTARGASLHVRPRVGTDVFLLAWLVREVAGDREPQVLEAVAPFDRARTARVTGVPETELQALLGRLVAAERPLVWSGLGVLLGPQGTLGWWLTVTLQALLGGLDRPGGWLRQPGAVDLSGWLRRLGVRGREPVAPPRPHLRGLGAILGTLPSATLADDVLRDAPDRLRALIVVGGDPASSLPDTRRATRALRSLELLVCVDLFETPTSRLGQVLLPAATWLERDETALHALNQRPVAHVRHDRAVVPPPGETREDFRILVDLCRAAGRPPFGSRIAGLALAAGLGPTGIARAALTLSGVPWAAVSSPNGATTPTRAVSSTVRLGVPELCDALRVLPDPEPGLRLLTSVRPIGAMNHWLRDGAPPVARLHPDDGPPGPCTLHGPGGSLAVDVVSDPELARGTVVLPYGDPRLNPNVLVGTEVLEPFTGQPVSNGTRVTITRATDS